MTGKRKGTHERRNSKGEDAGSIRKRKDLLKKKSLSDPGPSETEGGEDGWN